MKKLIGIIILSVFASTAMAQHHGGYYGGHRYHGGGYGWGWVAPALIGGAVVYAATRPPVVVQQPPVVVANPPVVVQQPPVMVQSNDVVYIDGIAYRKQVMLMNGVYQEVLVRM